MKSRLVFKNGRLVAQKVPVASGDESAQQGAHTVVEPPSEHDADVVNEGVRLAGVYRGIRVDRPETWAFMHATLGQLARCIPARNTGHAFNTAETRQIDQMGDLNGCAHCGALTPGERDGTRRGESTWIKDHYPPTDDLPPCLFGYDGEKSWLDCAGARALSETHQLPCPRHDAQQVLIPSCQDCSLAQGGGRNKSIYTKEVRKAGRQEWADPLAMTDLLTSKEFTDTYKPLDVAYGETENREAAQSDLGDADPIADTDRETQSARSGIADTTSRLLPLSTVPGGRVDGVDAVSDGRTHLPVLQDANASGPGPQPSEQRFGLVHVLGGSAKRGLAAMQSLPGVVCSNCAIQGECPKYEEGAACFFTDRFGALEVRNMDHLMAMREWLLDKQKVRVARSFMQEDLTGGGQIDPRVSQEMDRLARMIVEYEDTRHAPAPAPMQFQASMSDPSGSVAVQGSGRGIGLIARLFGAPTATMPNDPGRTEVVDTEATSTEKPPEK